MCRIDGRIHTLYQKCCAGLFPSLKSTNGIIKCSSVTKRSPHRVFAMQGESPVYEIYKPSLSSVEFSIQFPRARAHFQWWKCSRAPIDRCGSRCSSFRLELIVWLWYDIVSRYHQGEFRRWEQKTLVIGGKGKYKAINIRLPIELHGTVRHKAAAEEKSLNLVIVKLLEKGFQTEGTARWVILIIGKRQCQRWDFPRDQQSN